ncbi:ribosomal protein L7/L12 [Hyphomicrobium sp. DMF-1]|uniref:ribosomal protein L7/L12 n=1 Tax=Hyphomicrobium sp. DMF-1 TaxID=3019544 RepID=UPI0022EC01CF|nr:ribosomal protein L7/L12 [Hyphomicrobium sp. DMF-1]WBT40021.1 ribosomal protein L7/L12 [Hyphomicrobium sp. DMF-1]
MSELSPAYTLLPMLMLFVAGFIVGRATAPARAARQSRDIETSPAPAKSSADLLDALPADTQANVRLLLGSGRKIEAIRDVRHALGIGLTEAKDLVEHIEASMSRGARAS